MLYKNKNKIKADGPIVS